MHISICSVAVLFLTPIIHAQQIWDVVRALIILNLSSEAYIGIPQWSTTWDRSKLLTYNGLSSPINFGAPNVIGSADINVDDRQTYQTVWGFGGTLTDSAALVLSQLKVHSRFEIWVAYTQLIRQITDKEFKQLLAATFYCVQLCVQSVSS
jgi:hypothetical protein